MESFSSFSLNVSEQETLRTPNRKSPWWAGPDRTKQDATVQGRNFLTGQGSVLTQRPAPEPQPGSVKNPWANRKSQKTRTFKIKQLTCGAPPEAGAASLMWVRLLQGVPVPSLGAPVPSLGVPVPSLGAPVPSLGVPVPVLGAPVPSLGVPAPVPSLGAPVPSLGVPAPVPSLGAPVPSLGVPAPVPSLGAPVPVPSLDVSGCPPPSDAAGRRGKTSILDLYIPPPPAAPYVPLDVVVSSHPVSPNSSLDVRLADDPPDFKRLVPIRLRQRSASRGKPRPVSMPVDSVLAVSGSSSKRRTQGRKGRVEPHRYLSNERISAVPEEEPGFGLPSRGSVRGADHIRGSRCLVGADPVHGATMPYQEAAGAAAKRLPAAAQTRTKTGSTSVLGGWLARLRLLSH